MKNLVKMVMAMGLFVSMAARAEETRVKAEVLGSESKIGVKGSHGSAIRGYGAAFSLESNLSEDFGVGARVGYVKHSDPKDGDLLKFDDSFAGLYSTFDFLNAGGLSLYASGGASYHVVDFKSEASEGIRLSAADAYLWNWDAGIGSRLKLGDSVAMGVEYRYSDTLQRPDTKAVLSTDRMSMTSELKDLSLQSQQVAVSLSYAF